MSQRTDRLRRQLVNGLLRRAHLQWLAQALPPRAALVLFNFINAGISIGLVGIIALITHEAFIFPSLGASAFIIFHLPLVRAASPRNVFCAHLTGALCGWLSLVLLGLDNAPNALAADMDWPHVFSSALSLACTASLMVWLRIVHPPAAATALIVSLGLMPELSQIPVLMAGVTVLLIQAFLLNRLAGIPYPLWSPIRATPRKS